MKVEYKVGAYLHRRYFWSSCEAERKFFMDEAKKQYETAKYMEKKREMW